MTATTPATPAVAAADDSATGGAARQRRSSSAAAPLLLLAAWLLATLGVRPLLVPDEGRYVGVAREMLRGDGLTPLLDGLPFFHKPPLMYWIDMAAMSVFGINPFAARMAPAVGAWAMGAALYLALRRWRGEGAARLALGVLATSPFFFVGGQYANHDMLVAGCLTVAVLLFARAMEAPAAGAAPSSGWPAVAALSSGGSSVALGWLCAAWAAAGLAVLSKGLIGVVLPALIVGPWLLAQGRWRQMFRLLHPLGLLVFLAVAAPWMVAMELRHPGFLDYFIVDQHFRRALASTFNNPQPVWFYVALLPLMTLLWTAWLPPALKRLARERSPLLWLLAWWIVAVTGFFSLPHSKLVGYVLPVLAPLAGLLASAVSWNRRAAWVAGVQAVFCVGVVIGVGIAAPNSSAGAARALAARLQPGEQVVYVDAMLYDFAVVADLKEPVIVASAWNDGTVMQRDNWRKELYESARFDPALGARLLWPIDRLAELACGDQATWYVARSDNTQWIATVPGLEPVYADRRAQVLRAAPRRCAG